VKWRVASSPVPGVAVVVSVVVPAAGSGEMPLNLLFALSGDDAVVVGASGDPIGPAAPN